MKPRVFFYVQHLLGIGHLVRALRVARGLQEAGFAVALVMGGVPVHGLDTSGLDVIQLTPLKAGPQGFSSLVTVDGRPADDAAKSRRKAELLEAFARSDADVILIEAFPFGRRQVRFELVPLLEAAHKRSPRPRIATSVRDILQVASKPGRAEETVDLLTSYFDRVIVHGDPRLARLDATFPRASDIEGMVVYSGIVAPGLGTASAAVEADVVISAGGGAVGIRLFEAAIAAKPLTSLAAARWLALAGPHAEAGRMLDLVGLGDRHGVTVERFVPDLAAVLARARVSVSQAGYNTVADVLVAGCRAVLVPFEAGGETEQRTRATLLEQRGLGLVVPEARCTPGALADAIDRACALRPAAPTLDLDGARRTADIMRDLLADGT